MRLKKEFVLSLLFLTNILKNTLKKNIKYSNKTLNRKFYYTIFDDIGKPTAKNKHYYSYPKKNAKPLSKFAP
jgi:hypothetical protein